ncbi:MAG: arsenite methyltransferase [Candidatus Kapabacteria bacterium]|jgi:SAM-dependent methyltransferase|nr:arsenite methyltransferase [Candidatus Kapabacteria bacterium]
MNTSQTLDSTLELKTIVQEKYGAIAAQSGSGCGPSCGCGPVSISTDSIMNEDYSALQGYVQDADLSLGCGIPTQFANIKAGDTVVDLGSGAGNDAFIVRAIVGNTGRVIGVDFTEAMIHKARQNNAKLGFANVEFVQGDIEAMPLESEIADVVVSNCVLNLVPNKRAAFGEIFRVLKRGAHFTISDIVLEGALPSGIQRAAEMYAGCVSGAIQKHDYQSIIEEQGFINVGVPKEREIFLPDELLRAFITEAEIAVFRASNTRLLSITVVGFKP